MAEEQKTDTPETSEEAKIRAELDSLLEMPTAPRLDIGDASLAGIMSEQYAALARNYWHLRVQGEVCAIVGEKSAAAQNFSRAKKQVEQLTALGQLAEEHGVRDRYDELINAWLDKERDARAKERKERTHRAAVTGKSDPPLPQVIDEAAA